MTNSPRHLQTTGVRFGIPVTFLDRPKHFLAPWLLLAGLWSVPALAQWGLPTGQSTVGLGPRSVPASELTAETASLRSFLQRFPKIRFVIVDAPGNGHQSANLRVIRRLRELGFNGQIQAIYDDKIGAKLAVLVPGFDPAQSTSQRLKTPDLGAIEFIAQSAASTAISSEKVALGIRGAADEPSDPVLARRYNVRNFLQLQPRLWMFRTATREIIFENYDRVNLHPLTGLGPVNADSSIDDPNAFLNSQLLRTPEKEPWLKDLWNSFGNVDLLPAYSVDFPSDPVRMMTFVLGALREAQASRPDLFQKPIVVPVFSEFAKPGLWEQIAGALNKAGFSVRDFAESAAFPSGLASGEISVVRIGAVPAPVFEAIFERATLPVLLEGKNLTNVMIDHGLPFLNVVGSTRDVDDELSGVHRPTEEASSLVRGAISVLDERQSPFSTAQRKWLAAYFVEAKKPDGIVRNFFSSLRKDPASLDQDLVAQALMQLRDGMLSRKILPPLTCAAIW